MQERNSSGPKDKMINKLEIKNFKSIKDIKIICKKVNVFIGEPNTGKSNLLESLGFLSFLGGYASGLKKFVRILHPVDLFYDKKIKEKIIITINKESLIIEYRNGRLYLSGSIARPIELYPPFDSSSFPSEIRKQFENIKFYRFEARETFPSENADFLLPSGENLLIILETNREVCKIIGNLLSNFNLLLNLNKLEHKISIAKKIEGTIVSEIPYSLFSDTIQRLIYYLCAIETNKNSILIFEEPEAHAFPYYTKFLAEIVAEDTENQYFITTHNPYFLLSIIEKSEKDALKIFVTYMEDGETKVKEFEGEDLEILLDYEAKDIFFNIENILTLK